MVEMIIFIQLANCLMGGHLFERGRRRPCPADHVGRNHWHSRVSSQPVRMRLCYGPRHELPTTKIDMSSALPTLPAGPPAEACCAPSTGLDASLDADRLATLAKALAEPLRVQILDVLRRSDDDVCQCELIALFDIKQSLLSHHMRKLAEAGVVSVERRHKWAYYSVSTDALKELTAWLS